MEKNYYKNYFLGLLPANDAEKLELQVISNEDSEIEMLSAEENLIEDYLDGKLTNEEKQAFDKNFLVTEERRKRVEFIGLMRTYAEKKAFPSETKPGFFEQLKAFFIQRRLTLAFASVFLILTLGAAWQILFNADESINETEIAALNKRDLSNLNEFKYLKTLNLTSGTLRSGGNSSNLSEKDLTEQVLLRMALPYSAAENKDFTIEISQNGEVLQNFVQRSLQNQEVRILLPKSVLEKGEYQISLETDGEKYNYFFTVE